MATLKYEGREYTFEVEKATADEWREIKRKLRMTIRQVLQGVLDSDIDATTALRWLVLRSDRQHDDLVLDADAKFDVFAFLTAWKTYNDDIDAEKEPDPIQAGTLP